MKILNNLILFSIVNNYNKLFFIEKIQIEVFNFHLKLNSK